MAKLSGNYEVVYILDPAMGEEAIAAMVAKFKTMAEARGTGVLVDLVDTVCAALEHARICRPSRLRRRLGVQPLLHDSVAVPEAA